LLHKMKTQKEKKDIDRHKKGKEEFKEKIYKRKEGGVTEASEWDGRTISKHFNMEMGYLLLERQVGKNFLLKQNLIEQKM